MSRAASLAARSSVHMTSEQGLKHNLVCFTQNGLEAFYHAARAEALRESGVVCAEYAARLLGMSYNDHPSATAAACDLADELRAMADREVK